jgi:hypothetical protein
MTALKHSGLTIACAASVAAMVFLGNTWILRAASLVQSPALIAMSIFVSGIVALLECR